MSLTNEYPRTKHRLFNLKSPRIQTNSLGLLFDFLHIIDVSVKKVSHRVSDGRVFETWGDPKDCDIRYSRAQLSHSLTLKITNMLQQFISAWEHKRKAAVQLYYTEFLFLYMALVWMVNFSYNNSC